MSSRVEPAVAVALAAQRAARVEDARRRRRQVVEDFRFLIWAGVRNREQIAKQLGFNHYSTLHRFLLRANRSDLAAKLLAEQTDSLGEWCREYNRYHPRKEQA